MAGYFGYSKSNNAVAAEQTGRLPLTRAARAAGVPAALVKEHVVTREWHHSSKYFNKVDYYSVAAIEIAFGKRPATADEIEQGLEVDPVAVAALAAYKPAKDAGERIEGCLVDWIDWGGTRSRPTPYNQRAIDVAVTLKGQWVHIHLPTGDVKKKRPDYLRLMVARPGEWNREIPRLPTRATRHGTSVEVKPTIVFDGRK